MYDPVQEFEETLILRQGILRSIVDDGYKISLHFWSPRNFDIQFYKVADYRTAFPLFGHTTVRDWSACRESDFTRSVPGRRRRLGEPLRDDLDQFCHFHMTFGDGYLDVLAVDFVFKMVSW